MTRRSSKFLIDPEAHFILRPSDYDDPLAPWELLFANGPVHSNEPEHQAVVVALSPTDSTGDPEGDHSLGVEYLRWVADQLAGALQRPLILPTVGDYITAEGNATMMTQEMRDRYGYMLLTYGTRIHRQIEEYFIRTDDGKDYTIRELNEMPQQQFEDLQHGASSPHHDDSPYNIHHNHDTHEE